MKNHPSRLRLENKFDPSVSPGFLIQRWSLQFYQELTSARTRDEIWTAKCRADESIGIRSFAVEVLFSAFCQNVNADDDWLLHVCQLIARAGINYSDREKVRNYLSMIAAEYSGLNNCLTWCVCRPEETFSYYQWLSERPGISLLTPKKNVQPPKDDLKLLLAKCKSDAQKRTLSRLASIAMAVDHCKGEIAGVKLPRAAWIAGPSGSGKSWSALMFARCMGLPIYTATVGSWQMRNSRSESCTINEILRTLEQGAAVILIDEVDKFRMNAGDNENYFRAVLDEIMQLGTATLHDFHPSPTALKNLKRSWFLHAGAFQALYRKKLGGQAIFLEQIESLELTVEDILEAGWLPDELVNRMGWYIECGAPTTDELSAAMHAIEKECGIVVPNAEREGHAKQCSLNMHGFRGIENYALRCAQHAIALASKERRQEPPKLPPDAGPKNPSWF